MTKVNIYMALVYIYTNMYTYMCICIHIYVYVYIYTQTNGREDISNSTLENCDGIRRAPDALKSQRSWASSRMA
jgi:type IV secretory pathway VirB3-like protein